MERKGFTLMEVVVVLVILLVLVGMVMMTLRRQVEKSQETEAVLTVSQIQKAEELHKMEKGSYVAADSTEEINQKLRLSIPSKNFEYRVVDVTEDNFIVLAQRIRQDVASGDLPEEPVVVAMDKTGSRSPASVSAAAQPTADGGTVVDTGGGEVSGGGGGGTPVGSGGGGGGTVSGDSGTSGGTGTTRTVVYASSGPVYDSQIASALDFLKNSESGEYVYNLIMEQEISVVYADLSSYDEGDYILYAHYVPLEVRGDTIILNTIEVNQILRTRQPEPAIAAEIAHEARHADYLFNTEAWIADTLVRHPELTEADITFDDAGLANTIDQEYMCRVLQAQVWEELKGEYQDTTNESNLSLYAQGESYLKDYIRDIPAYASLAEY